MTKQPENLQGILWIMLGMLIFSLQNIAIKWISGGYPVFQIVIIRSLMALPLTILLFRFEGGIGLPKTKQQRLEIYRGLLLFSSYTTYFMGLSALPLAEAASIRFSAPIIITFFSVTLMGEKVGWRRWTALIIGFAGVLFIVRPGTASFNLGSQFMAIGTTLYALSTWLTRRLKEDDSSATMAFYSTQVYLTAAFILTPIVLWIGELPNAHPSIAFLFRPWTTPTLPDLGIMLGLGFVWAVREFVQDTPQSDDITLLALRYLGK